MSQNVKIFKLVSGEEIVTHVSHECDDFLYIIKPQSLILTQQGPRLLPFFFAAAGSVIPLAKSALITLPMDAPMELAQAYTKSVSDIEIPDANTSRILSSRH